MAFGGANSNGPEKDGLSDYQQLVEAKRLLKDILGNYRDDSEWSLIDREHLEKKIKKFLKIK